MKLNALCLALAFTASASFALATDATPGAKVYFINVKNGDHVKSPFLVQFGLSGMGIAPAGATNPATGHHHLMIDTDAPPAGLPIGMDMMHVHYGRGQSEAMVTLMPGSHTLQLVLADGGHIPFTPSVQSDKITVTVDP